MHGDGLHTESPHLHYLVQQGSAEFLPEVPYVLWAIFFAGLFTILNLRGVETSARINAMMAAALGVVIVLVVASIFALSVQACRTSQGRSTRLLFMTHRRSHRPLFSRDVDRDSYLYWLRWHLDFDR